MLAIGFRAEPNPFVIELVISSADAELCTNNADHLERRVL
jgi:hypothetical protein